MPPTPESSEKAKFDAYSRTYEALHAANISSSGESTEYFHRYKLECLLRAGAPTDAPILDYGAGIGNLTRLLCQRFAEVHAFDLSAESLAVAKERASSAQFHYEASSLRDGYFGSVVLSGVLHHVPPNERLALLSSVRSKLRPGGSVYVFEHNPLNPLTRRAVATCEFDDDAILLWPWEAKRQLVRAGFQAVNLDYIVFFPRALARLRPWEPRLNWLPIGAQVFVRGVAP
jgi:2-polyprenyl-3-methyl-5-hydroxy-6-metoxy-1,4-benzoquinol methylase